MRKTSRQLTGLAALLVLTAGCGSEQNITSGDGGGNDRDSAGNTVDLSEIRGHFLSSVGGWLFNLADTSLRTPR